MKKKRLAITITPYWSLAIGVSYYNRTVFIQLPFVCIDLEFTKRPVEEINTKYHE